MELLLFGNALCFGLITYVLLLQSHLAASKVREKFPDWRTLDDLKYSNLVELETNIMKESWGWMWNAHYLLTIPIIIISCFLDEFRKPFAETVVQTIVFGVVIALALLLASGVQIARKKRRRKCKR